VRRTTRNSYGLGVEPVSTTALILKGATSLAPLAVPSLAKLFGFGQKKESFHFEPGKLQKDYAQILAVKKQAAMQELQALQQAQQQAQAQEVRQTKGRESMKYLIYGGIGFLVLAGGAIMIAKMAKKRRR
jgi:hypothetical protein